MMPPDFPTRLARSRALYDSGEEAGRRAIVRGTPVSPELLAAYPRHERASLLLGAANARRALVIVPSKAPAHRAKLRAAALRVAETRQAG